MTGPAPTNRWREEGHAIAAALDAHASAVVIGRDTERAAEVALGIAEIQAKRRRVAVADLVGEVAPLQSLVPPDMVHGVTDAFVHGVSLNRIAHPVDRAGNLFIMQSGVGPIDYPLVLRDDRWRRLASGFRETDALLLAVVPEGAPGVDAIAHALGGIVTVDDARVPGVAPIIASAGGTPPPAQAPSAGEEPLAPTRRPSPPDAAELLRRRSGSQPRAREKAGIGLWIAIAAGLLLGSAAVLGWANRERFGWSPSASTPLTQPTEPPAPDRRFGAITNPEDSARASGYVVVIANVTDSAAAGRRILESLAALPAPTFSPDTPWYRVSVGAFATEAAADTFLRELRARQVLEPESGYLLRAPYSLLLITLADSAAVRDSLASLRLRGVPAFALRASDATVMLYAGAYETPDQAADALAVHQLAVPEAVVAYRVGRAY
ncbi:MAG TPA: SPOR domain-containing protein [Gemmatimonadaceae bacterium]|nr:SPOR domain-containing protein [Gemmatimonadaceae bacterium]